MLGICTVLCRVLCWAYAGIYAGPMLDLDKQGRESSNVHILVANAHGLTPLLVETQKYFTSQIEISPKHSLTPSCFHNS